MRLIVSAALALCASVAGVPAAAAAVPGAGHPAPAASRDAFRDARLTAAIRHVMTEFGVPGAVVGVWQPGRPSYVRALGVRNRATRQPMTAGLELRIGSETKTFVATALLQLASQHKLSLDDKIWTYVPGVPDGSQITLRDLADMRSGLFDYTADSAWLRAAVGNVHRTWTPQQLLPYSFSHPLAFRPGLDWQYSNTNYILLGLVIEKVTGLPLATYLTRHVLRPSGLTSTFLPGTARFPGPHADGYTEVSPSGPVEDATTWTVTWAGAAGAMTSTLGDLARWARIVATGTLLTPAAQREREHFLPTGLPRLRYGIGLFSDNGWIGHDGSVPGYQSLALYLPSTRTTLVALINSDIPAHGAAPIAALGDALTHIITPHHTLLLGQ